jgi:hypothetical protein
MCIFLLLAACTTTNDEVVEYINEQGHTFTFSSVSTPNNSTIQTLVYSSSLTTAERDELNDIAHDLIRLGRWDSVRLRHPTLAYNCHSYAWHSTATNNTHWINQWRSNGTANLSLYWTDGSHSFVASVTNGSIPTSARINDKVFYSHGDHSAIKTSSTQFTSKWGAGGLFRHSPRHAPYANTQRLSYYR